MSMKIVRITASNKFLSNTAFEPEIYPKISSWSLGLNIMN